MLIRRLVVIKIWRYFWLAAALALIGYVLSQGIVTSRLWEYDLNWRHSVSHDIYGWYPVQRTRFDVVGDRLEVLGEPLYLQVYSPIRFDLLTVEGSLDYSGKNIKLGLKQQDGSWQFKDVSSSDFSLSWILEQAQFKRNKIEMILSINDLRPTSTVYLMNNWHLKFSR